MSSKSPYEIRSDLLHLSFNIVQGQKEAAAAQKAKDDNTAMFVTEAPTTAEIIAEASKLNDFVSATTQP